MFTLVGRVAAATALGSLGAGLILSALGRIGNLGDASVLFAAVLCFPSALLGILFAGPAGWRGSLRGAKAGAGLAALAFPLGPGIALFVLPLAVAGGIAAAIFPREAHGKA